MQWQRHHDDQGGAHGRAWGRSALVATALHVAAAAVIVICAASPGPDDVAITVAPIVSVALAPAETVAARPAAASPGPTDAPAPAPAAEPDVASLGEIVRTRLLDDDRPDPADAMARLVREAAVLERISNAHEVERMSRAITKVMNVRDRALSPAESPPPGPFDFDTGLVTESIRRQTRRRTEVRETLTDAAGRSITIVTARLRDEATSAVWYEQSLIEPNRRNTFRAAEEDFQAAEQRHRPFELMRRFPLVGRLHRQAVLPILDLLADDATRPTAAATTRPVERRQAVREQREQRPVSWSQAHE